MAHRWAKWLHHTCYLCDPQQGTDLELALKWVWGLHNLFGIGDTQHFGHIAWFYKLRLPLHTGILASHAFLISSACIKVCYIVPVEAPLLQSSRLNVCIFSVTLRSLHAPPIKIQAQDRGQRLCSENEPVHRRPTYNGLTTWLGLVGVQSGGVEVTGSGRMRLGRKSWQCDCLDQAAVRPCRWRPCGAERRIVVTAGGNFSRAGCRVRAGICTARHHGEICTRVHATCGRLGLHP